MVFIFHFSQLQSPIKKAVTFSIFLFSILILQSCSASERFTSKEEVKIEERGTAIRVLLNESEDNFTYVVKNQITIRDASKKIALVKSGNSLQFIPDEMGTVLKIGDKTFKADYFLLENEENSAVTKFNGNVYGGVIKVLTSGQKINVINTVALEEYVKGVLPSEMPVGKGEAYIESFKAFAICARTYAINRIQDGKPLFDIYADTRDQVYGGSGKGTRISDKAVDDTKGIILTYKDDPAIIFYHSTCGGSTEKVDNVFLPKNITYLAGVTDGEPSYCSESPRFRWEEVYDAPLFVRRLFQAGYIPHAYFELKKIHIKSRFESGRINELQILLADASNTPRTISLFGNSMRSVIRTADNSTILRSNYFDIDYSGKTVTITGRGYGHGVGLCQWGAMNLSSKGRSYKQILSHYYPGTTLKNIND